MRQQKADHNTATVYQYKLTKKLVIRRELIQSHFILIAIFLGFQILLYGKEGLFSWLAGFAALQIIHIILLLITFIGVTEATDRKWIWRINPPWIGFKPANDISLPLFRRIHRHLFWIGLCIIAVLYPWIPASLMLSLVSWHIWLIAPRLLLAFYFRKQPKNGVLRLQSYEALYYSI